MQGQKGTWQVKNRKVKAEVKPIKNGIEKRNQQNLESVEKGYFGMRHKLADPQSLGKTIPLNLDHIMRTNGRTPNRSDAFLHMFK